MNVIGASGCHGHIAGSKYVSMNGLLRESGLGLSECFCAQRVAFEYRVCHIVQIVKCDWILGEEQFSLVNIEIHV